MALPTIWHYHPVTGVLLSPGLADQSPLDAPGTWLTPAFTTDVDPPTVPEGQQAVFVDGGWQLVALPPEAVQHITEAPADLFGGPTLEDVLNGN